MKTKVLSVMTILLAALMIISAANLAPVSVADTQTETQRIVSVNGEGSVTVTPDIAYIDLGVQTKNADAQKAQKENADKMSAVLDAVKKAGVKADNIKTTGYNIYQTSDYNQNGDVKTEYYVVNNIVNLKIEDITAVGKIIDAAAGAGANDVNSIRFTVADDSKYYAEALKLAMQDANSKATAIMATFNKKPGLPSNVSEVSYGGGLRAEYATTKAMMDSVATPIESGEITITANVNVGYDY